MQIYWLGAYNGGAGQPFQWVTGGTVNGWGGTPYIDWAEGDVPYAISIVPNNWWVQGSRLQDCPQTWTVNGFVVEYTNSPIPEASAPHILIQPVSQTNYVGVTVRLNVFATATWPFGYQWRKEGLNLGGATNSTLVLSNVTMAASGDYSVVLSNSFGSVTSEVAQVAIKERPWPYVEEFQGSVGGEWSHRQTDITPVGNRRFLGQFGNDTVSLTLNGLPAHQGVTVSFDLFIIRSWDGGWAGPEGDVWDLSVAAGPTLLHTTFNNHSGGAQAFPGNFPGVQHPSQAGAAEIAKLGYDWPQPTPDCAYYLSFSFPHTGSSLRLDFSGMGLQDIGDESWGLDNVRVELSPAPTNTSYIRTTLAPTYASPLPVTNTIHRGAISGIRAAALCGDGSVQWLDLKDPAKPLLLGTWEPFLMPCDIAAAGNLVYIASWELDFLSTVEIVDFSDPSKPVLRGYYDTPGYAQDVAIAGSRAYVADGEGGLHILDVSDPAFPQRLGGYNIHGSVDRVQVSGHYAYITVGNWVCVLDVSDPGNPRRAGVYEAPGGIQSLKVSGSKLYLAQATGALQILDVSDPGNIMLLGSYRSYGTEAIAVAGQFAYLAGSGGVRVLDVSNPTNITWLASAWNISAQDVALMGNYAVVAGGNKGLAIYQLQQSIYPPLKPPVIAGGMMTLTWPYLDGARLQMATNLAKPYWQDIPESEGTNIVSLPLTEGAAFFRLAMGPKLTDRFVWIPPGTFTMGSPPTEVDRFDSEGPQTAVTISRGFWMGKYEVTQGEYESVRGTNPSWFTGDPNRPVEQVSWQDATAYCDALTQQERAAGRIPRGYDYRLPTEAEWEYACRAGTSTRFSYGDDHGYTNLINYGWWDGNNGGTTHPVGQKLPNPWGLHEMHGNVWEWCQDWWSESLPGGIAVDPQGPATGPGRMGRGGGWDYNAKLCRSAFRAHFGGPGSWFVDVGFRIVLAQGQP